MHSSCPREAPRSCAGVHRDGGSSRLLSCASVAERSTRTRRERRSIGGRDSVMLAENERESKLRRRAHDSEAAFEAKAWREQMSILLERKRACVTGETNECNEYLMAGSIYNRPPQCKPGETPLETVVRKLEDVKGTLDKLLISELHFVEVLDEAYLHLESAKDLTRAAMNCPTSVAIFDVPAEKRAPEPECEDQKD